MEITRRMTHLTLARREWQVLARELAADPETAKSCSRALDSLKAQTERSPRPPDETLTIAQPPLNWSPVIFGLSLRVLQDPTLLPIAERLRDQMEAQARRIDGMVAPELGGDEKAWRRVVDEDLSHRIGAN